jgi:hypothetical protein
MLISYFTLVFSCLHLSEGLDTFVFWLCKRWVLNLLNYHAWIFICRKPEVGCYWYMVHEKELWLQLKAQPKYVQGMSATMSSYHQLKMEHSKIRGNIGRMTQLLHWLGINWTASWQHVASLSFLVFCDCKFNSSLPLLDKWNRKVEWFLFCEACSNLPNLFFMFRLPTLCCSTYENVLLAY